MIKVNKATTGTKRKLFSFQYAFHAFCNTACVYILVYHPCIVPWFSEAPKVCNVCSKKQSKDTNS